MTVTNEGNAVLDGDELTCPLCGGMLVTVVVPRGKPCIWCTECETLWEADDDSQV